MDNAHPYRLALAGLLHDIGKFAQRAGEQVSAEWSDGKTQADFKYQHALHSWHFINRYVPREFQVGVLAAYHHRPQNSEQRLIRLADQLSAGERDTGQTRDDSDRTIHPKQLHPIFTQITLQGQPHPASERPKHCYLPLKPLALQREVLFPTPDPLADEEVWDTYAELWRAFCREAEALKPLPLEAYLEAMQALMQRYTWCIPAAYFDTVPDISLYDHSRMTAALAVCLGDFEDEAIETLHATWQKGGDDTPVALLVGGDISGVQDFIYTISAKGAAKSLRGRSFYLQLLTEAVLRFVLRELNLPYTNVIYSGGGHFFLLAPLSAAPALEDIQAAVTRKLLRHHGSSLYLALGWSTVPLKGFNLGAFSTYWDAMHRNLQEAKAHRYTELGEEMYSLVFTVPTDGGGDKHCVVCGADDVPLQTWKEEEDQYICPQCLSYVEGLGKKLPRSHAIHWHWRDPEDTARHDFAAVLRAFGAEVTLLQWEDLPNLQSHPRDALWLMDDPPPGQTFPPVATWLRYAVNQIPREGNTPLPFDELQKRTQGGFQRLGVLRMDVDNLGDVFKHGLGKKATLSRLSALSSQMSLFFEGWVKRIIAEGNRQRLIYAVYAGGDDVFLIGPWDIMPEVAQAIAAEFHDYTGGHPALHLSGGMAFIHGKYPVYQAAADAGAAEHLAKQHEGKNAFAFLGTAWPWPEFKALQDKQEILTRVASGESGGSKSILMLLRNLAKMESNAADCQGRPVWGRWMWMAAYHLTRAIERNKSIKKDLEFIRDDMENSQYRTMPHWGTAARWAQLKLRKGK